MQQLPLAEHRKNILTAFKFSSRNVLITDKTALILFKIEFKKSIEHARI